MSVSCYSSRRLIINLKDESFRFEEIERSVYAQYVGGRGINAFYAYSKRLHLLEDAFSEDNRILLAPGALVGMPCLFANRMTITAKSPLTDLLGDSNVGGDFGIYLKWAEIDQVVIENKASRKLFLVITRDKCIFEDADDIWGKDADEADYMLNDRFKSIKYLSTLIIGPAGEQRVKFASIHSGVHAAGRTGLGAVMGDKNLKAIVVRGNTPKFKNLGDNKEYMKRLADIVRNDPAYDDARQYGATTAIEGFNRMGVLEVKNLTTGVWGEEHKFSGKYLRDNFTVKRYGCLFCNIHCKGVSRFKKEEGGEEFHGPEFAAMQNFGPRIGNSDLESVCRLARESNRKGIDLMSMGGILSWLMECLEKGYLAPENLGGIDLAWGKVEESLDLISRISLREGIGDLLAEGAERASGIFGGNTHKCLLTIKKMEFEGCDPRGYKGRGVGFGVSSRGADNCRSLSAFESVITREEAKDLFGSEEAASFIGVKGKGRLLKFIEDQSNVADLLGICRLGMYVFASSLDGVMKRCDAMAGYFRSVSGPGVCQSYEDLVRASERTINLERIMLSENGYSRKDDVLPERFRKEPMPAGPVKGQVVENEDILEEYYQARGWTRNGMVTQENQKKLFGGVLYEISETGNS